MFSYKSAKTENQKAYIDLRHGSWSHVGEKSDVFAIEKFSSLTTKDFFNDATFTLESNYLNDVFNRLYPNITMTKGQAFIGYGTVIENAVGTNFEDTIHGNATANKLEGEDGSDTFVY